jgi:predicted lipid-binding transport protein (Tim44 family)
MMKQWSELQAWLASTLGVGEAMAGWVIAVAVGLVVVLLGVWLWGRASRTKRAPAMAFQGGAAAQPPRPYSPRNVGNDASARPWEHSQVPGLEPVLAEAAPAPGPEGFDRTAFLEASKSHFVSLQQAWDRADIPALRAMMTEEMASLIQGQLSAREQAADVVVKQSEVLMLEAKLLGLDAQGPGWVASVEFSGLMRDDPSAGPNPFREVWSITRPRGGADGWLVAGVQALQ